MTTHIEEFARCLRELKERSGRSYGMLATRLHVSTSTLHRYCNGAAVPGEYAPVERFARQCGADAEELVALHQRWLLADAARRREPHRAPDPKPGQLPSVEGTSADLRPEQRPPGDVPPAHLSPAHLSPGDAPAADLAPGDARSGDVPFAHRPPVGTPPEALPAASAPPAPPPPPSDGPASSDGPAAPGVHDLPDVAHTPAPGRRRPGRRARRTTVVLAAAAALAAVLPLVLRGGHGTDDTGAVVPPTTAGAPQRPSPSAPASGRTHAPASASASATATARSTPTGSSVSVRPVTGGKPPVQVAVMADNWDTPCDQWFLLKQQPENVPPPPSLQEGSAWAAALGGIPAGRLRLQLTAQGLPGQPVVLHALYVKVLSSAAAPKGNAYTPADGCGGGIDPASFSVDLDSTAPRARAVPGSVDDGKKTGTVDFPFQISANDPQVLDVDGHSLDRDVRWYMDLVWSCGARQGTLRVDNGGAPFRTIGMKGDTMYNWTSTRWYSDPAN